ncbi:MAG: hypothetical protein V2A73_16685, partial [Pseudomonadota bacterium]
MTTNKSFLFASLEQVAEHLGDGWSAKGDERAGVGHLQGPTFELFVRRNDRRLNISLSVLSELYQSRYGAECPGITVGETRAPRAIAGEIERRILPQATALWAKLLERKASEDDYEARRQATLKAVVAVLGELASGYDQCYHWSVLLATG